MKTDDIDMSQSESVLFAGNKIVSCDVPNSVRDVGFNLRYAGMQVLLLIQYIAFCLMGRD